MWSQSTRRRRRKRTPAALLPAALILAASGCCSDKCGPADVDRCADIPCGAIPQPTGTYACQWQNAHAMLADQDHFTIYEHEWRGGGDELGPYGQRHIDEIAENLEQSPHQIIVEPHFDVDKNQMDDARNEARRKLVVAALEARNIPGAEDRVVIGRPRGEGLYGEEAARLGQQRLSRGGQGAGGGGRLGIFGQGSYGAITPGTSFSSSGSYY